MADQLAIWNVALAHLGERRLASLTEPREPARVLADEWTAAVRGCLEMTAWQFATRTQGIPASGDTPPNGFLKTFPKPQDWLRTTDLAADSTFATPLEDYVEEGPNWYANTQPIWARYVSIDSQYGFNVNAWSQAFADLVALALAARCCRRLTGSGEMLGDLVKLREAAARDALALEEATAARRFPQPTGYGETKLQVFNDALAHLGRARVPSLTQTDDAVRELNDQYRSALRWCLQSAPWNFAASVIEFAPSTDAVPKAGFNNAFKKPADWIRTCNISGNSILQAPLDNYVEEGLYWFANPAFIAVRYVSITLGGAPERWPPTFCALLALRLAELSCGRLAPDAKDLWPQLVKLREEAEGRAYAAEYEQVGRVYPVSGPALTQLQTYNDALALLGKPRVVGLTDATETVRTLNDQWPAAVRWTLEQGPWSFAARTATLACSVGGTSGYSLAAAKPIDWVMTLDLAQDAGLTIPLTDYVDEAGHWSCGVAALTVRYVSADSAYGLNLALWPSTFREVVAIRLAELCAGRLGATAPAVEQRAGALQAAQEVEATRSARVYPAGTDAQTQLRVYNAALAYLGRPRVAALTETSALMRLLHDTWNLAARWALEQGPWTFAIRAIAIGTWGGLIPTFGYRNAFKKPDDWIATTLVSLDDHFRQGLTAYADETGFWFADAEGLFVRYVSVGPNYGMNLGRWSPSFADLVAARMAELVAPQIGAALPNIVQQRDQALKRQRATDAMNTPPVFPPTGSWVAARRGASGWARPGSGGAGGAQVPFTSDTSLGADTDLPADSDFVPRISG